MKNKHLTKLKKVRFGANGPRPDSAPLYTLSGFSPSPLDLLPASQEVIEFERDWLLAILNTSTWYRARNEPIEFDTVLEYRMRGYLSVEIDAIPPCPPRQLGPAHGSTSESRDHVMAKRLGEAWLAHRGGEPVVEKRRYGGRVDVFCENLGVAIECGSLSVRRLEEMLFDSTVNEVIVIPLGDAIAQMLEGIPSWVPIFRFKITGPIEELREQRRANHLEMARAAAALIWSHPDVVNAAAKHGVIIPTD